MRPHLDSGAVQTMVYFMKGSVCLVNTGFLVVRKWWDILSEGNEAQFNIFIRENAI